MMHFPPERFESEPRPRTGGPNWLLIAALVFVGLFWLGAWHVGSRMLETRRAAVPRGAPIAMTATPYVAGSPTTYLILGDR